MPELLTTDISTDASNETGDSIISDRRNNKSFKREYRVLCDHFAKVQAYHAQEMTRIINEKCLLVVDGKMANEF